MRASSLILAAGCLFCAGCAQLIKHSGTNISTLATRDEVHEEFGDPIRVSERDGSTVEEYVTRRKIADPFGFRGLGEEYALTLGLGEFIWFPQELYTAVNRSIVGQRLEFTYGPDGHVIYMRQDDEPIERHPYSK